MQEHLKKRKTCQCSEQQQVCNWDIPATREPELGSESFGARDLPGEGLAELAAAAQTAVEAAASSSPSPAQQMLPVQTTLYRRQQDVRLRAQHCVSSTSAATAANDGDVNGGGIVGDLLNLPSGEQPAAEQAAQPATPTMSRQAAARMPMTKICSKQTTLTGLAKHPKTAVLCREKPKTTTANASF
ncbi:uncharacterized protein LOC144116351 isoform X6 [Amblyomma americanum]